MKIGNSGHKWFGCILGVGRANRGSLDLQHHLQAASRVFLCPQTNTLRLKGSACGHRTVHQSDLCRMDVLCRKLHRMMVGVKRIWIGLVPGTRFCTSGT